MAIQLIQFDPAGDRIQVEIKFGYAQVGVYTFILWEAASNNMVMEENGNNVNTEPDRYGLPLPTANNDGRIIDCFVTVGDPDFKPGDRYSINIVLTQGETQIGCIVDEGDMTDSSISRRLFAKLIKS